MTEDQSLYVKLLIKVNIDQIDEFFSGPIEITITSVVKSRTIMFDKNTQLIF